MKSTLRTVAIGLAITVAVSVAVVQGDDGWATYRNEEYGFSMLMPVGTVFVEEQFGGGWFELWAEYQGVKFYALAKLGEQATPEEIERIGVKLTGIPAGYWKQIDQGRNDNGWNWYRTVRASRNGVLVFGGYGTGRRGSYLLILETTERDYQAYKSDYHEWYESIRLH